MTALSETLQALRTPGFEVLDCHGHLGPWLNFRMPRYSGDEIARVMDLIGIDRTFVSPMSGMVDEALGLADLREAVQHHGGRLVPVPVANPNRVDAALQLLGECSAEFGTSIVKIHPDIHDAKLTGSEYRAILDACDKRWAILTHTWAGSAWSSPYALATVAERHPDTNFIAGHSGGPLAGVRESIEVAKEHPNISLDLTGSLQLDGVIEWMVDELGPSRVLFGTDVAFLDPRPQLGRVLTARIDDEAKRMILGDNLKRLIGEGRDEHDDQGN